MKIIKKLHETLYAVTHAMQIQEENRILAERNEALADELKAERERAEESDCACYCAQATVMEMNSHIFQCKQSARNAVNYLRTNNISADCSAKAIYMAISPVLDPDGFELLDAAKKILGEFEYSFFPYEDNRGIFEMANGHQMLPYLLVQYADKLGEANYKKDRWKIVSSCYEECANTSIDKTTPEYQAFEKQLYTKVLERLDILTPAITQEEVAA